MSGFFVFISILILAFIALDIYLIKKLQKIAILQSWNNWIIRTVWLSSVVSLIILIIVFSNRLFNTLGQATLVDLLKFVSIWYLPKLLIFVIAFPIDIFRFIKGIIVKLFFKNTSNQIILAPNSSRRKFVQNSALGFAGIPFAFALKGSVYNVSNLRIYKENIQILDLPINLNNLKIVQISDLHFGSFPDKNTIKEMCNIIDSLYPDIIFITGDFVNFDPKELELGLLEVSRLKSKYGSFAILGNHDHYMTDNDHNKLISKIRESGINLLINENITLSINNENLNIVGVDNSGTNQNYADWDKAYANLDKRNKTILLCHDPSNWDKNIIDRLSADLTLSGHTHGGQIALSFMGLELSPAQLVYKQYAGLYSHKNQYLYVNRGIGTSGPPMRIGMDPEISLLTLKIAYNLARY